MKLLESERLRLRMFGEEDITAYHEMLTHPEVCHWFGDGDPPDRMETWRQVAAILGHWQLRGYGLWAMEEKATGSVVGVVGLWHPDGFPEHELGWDLFDGATGKGYATEAGRAARAFAYDTLGWTTLISLIADGNTGSEGVATRLGAAPDGRFTHERYGTMTMWRHPSPEAL